VISELIKNHFSSLYNIVNDVVVLYKKDEFNQLIITEANEAFFRETGYQRDKVINYPLEQVFNNRITQMMYHLISKISPDNLITRFDSDINLPLGILYWSIQLQAFMYHNKLSNYYISVSVNVSEKKELTRMINRLRTISQIGRIGGWEYDVNESQVFWTEEMFVIHETDYSFVPDKASLTKFYDPDDQKRISHLFMSLYQNALTEMKSKQKNSQNQTSTRFISQESLDFVCQLITAKSKRLWIRIVCKAMIYKNGKIKYYGVVQDVTEQTQLQKQLQFEQKKIKEILETQKDLLCRSLPDTTILYVNQAYADYFKTSVEKLIGTKFIESIPQFDHDYVHKSISMINWKNQFNEVEHQVITSDGSLRWMQWTDYGIFDQSGQLIEIQSNGRDITEKKLLESELKKRESLYRTLLDTTPHSIILIDSEAYICYANYNISKLLETSHNSVTGTNVCKWINHSVEQVRKMLKRIENKNKILIFEVKILTISKKAKDCEIYISTMKMPDNTHQFLITISDISERKQALKNQYELERLQNQSMRLSTISALSAGITHEINQPLNAMKIIVDGLIYLKNRDFNTYESTVDEKLYFLSEQIQRIESIIFNIRSMIYDKPEISSKYFDIHRCVDSVLNIFRKDFELSNIKVNFKSALKYPLIKCYPIQIEQILINVISNSIHIIKDHLPYGEGEINLFTSIRNGKFFLSIHNNGPHLNQDEKIKIFEPFYTNKKDSKGTGLGLTICYQIISSLGGNIQAENTDPQGVVFKINLPEGS